MKRIMTMLLALILSTAALEAQWIQTNGPEGGSISAIATVGNTVLAATWPEALYRLDTVTSRWTRIGTKMIERLDVVQGVIIASTDHGLERSSDLGASWTPVGLPTGATIETVDESDFFASDGPTLFVSIDRGLNWREFGSDWARIGEEQFDLLSFTTRGNIMVAVGDQPVQGVIRSGDGGQKWEVVGAGLPEGSMVTRVAFLGDTLLAQVVDPVAHRSLGIYVSADFGTNWSEMNEGRSEGDRGYPGIFFFYRDGASIAASTARGTIRLEGDRWIGTSENLASAVAFDAAGRSYRGDFSGISRSDDGQTWERIDRGLLSQDIPAITGSGNTIIASSGNGIFRSTDRGLEWNRTGLIRAEKFAHIGSVVLAQGSRFTEQGMVRSTNDGLSWEDVNLGVSHPLPWITSIAATPELAYATFQSLRPFDLVDFLYEGGIYRSLDSGRTWSLLANGLPRRNDTTVGFAAVAAIGQSAVAVAFDEVYRTTDGGTSWIPGGTGLPSILSQRGLIASAGSYFLAIGATVWRSDDAGETWTVAGGAPLREFVYSISDYDGTVAAITGGEVGPQSIYVLRNEKWIEFGETLPEQAIGHGLASIDGTTYLATGNRSVLRLADGSAGVDEETSTLGTSWSPFPLRDEARVRFTLAAAGTPVIELYDITGRLALRHDAGRMGVGSYELVIPVSSLRAGVYGYRIDSNGESARGTVVIAR